MLATHSLQTVYTTRLHDDDRMPHAFLMLLSEEQTGAEVTMRGRGYFYSAYLVYTYVYKMYNGIHVHVYMGCVRTCTCIYVRRKKYGECIIM